MSNKVKPENFSREIQMILNSYKNDVTDELKETADSLAKEAKATVASRSPVSTKSVNIGKGRVQEPGAYKNGWKINRRTGVNFIDIKINNKYYQLTHLLEFGHAKKGGMGRTKAIPHIRKTEQEYIQKLQNEMRNKIKGG